MDNRDDRERQIRALFALANLEPTDFAQHCVDRGLTVDDTRYVVLTLQTLLDADPGELAVRLATDRIIGNAKRALNKEK